MQQIRRSSLRGILTVSALSAAAAASFSAQAGEGFYLGVEGGLNFATDQKFIADEDGTGGLLGTLLGTNISKGDQRSKVNFNEGWLGGITAGYKLESGLRPELEINYRKDDLDKAKLSNGNKVIAGGSEKTTGAFANLWFDLLKDSPVHPYIGGGVGLLNVDIDKTSYGNTQLDSDNDKVFAYQGGAGVIFELSKQVDATLDYRYLSSNKGKYDLDGAAGTALKTRYESQVAMISLRYYFDSPEPPPPPPAPEPVVVVPPPPPPPPCESDPAKTINLAGCKVGDTVILRGVNFDFDKATLTVNAKTLLDQVGDALIARPDIKVEIAGHTDDKGSDEYNQKLSERRAASVVEYLTGRGIDSARLTSVGYGESRPVADNGTDEGREENRRVELSVTAADSTAAPVVSEPASPSAVPAADATAAPAAPAEGAAAPAEAAPAAVAPTEAAPAAAEETALPAPTALAAPAAPEAAAAPAVDPAAAPAPAEAAPAAAAPVPEAAPTP